MRGNWNFFSGTIFLLHKIQLLTVGKVKTPWIGEGIEVYGKRLSHFCDFQPVVLSAGSLEEEGKRILAHLKKQRGAHCLLDDAGKQFSSPQFGAWLGNKRDLGEPICFVIGGAYGVSDEVRRSVSLSLSLSAMTFPHELCQLLFLEQLYRAHSILAGSGYHH